MKPLRGLSVDTGMCYSPLSEYEFQNLKDDKDIKNALNCGNIYLICGRPRLFFKDVSLKDGALSVKVFQKFTSKEFQFDIDLLQKYIWDGDGICSIEVGQYAFGSSSVSWFETSSSESNQNSSNQMYDGIKVYKINSKQEKTFVVWFNPEKLIHLILQKTINASLTGDAQDLFSLVNYDVLYVGRTNNMHWRQSHHEHVQEILAREQSKWGDLPTHEICLVSLCVASAEEIVPLGTESEEGVYNKEDYYYDLEKALVRALDPFYNRDKFLNYPSQDKSCILHSKLKYDILYYSFDFPIAFNCKGKHIRGYNNCIRVSSDGTVGIVDLEDSVQ